jgi:hypothetical protein
MAEVFMRKALALFVCYNRIRTHVLFGSYRPAGLIVSLAGYDRVCNVVEFYQTNPFWSWPAPLTPSHTANRCHFWGKGLHRERACGT